MTTIRRTNSEQFRRDLARVKPHVVGQSEKFVRAVVRVIGKTLILRSPVDTGEFRGNWNVGINAIDPTTNENRKDKEGSASIARLNTQLGMWRMGQTIYITNSLPYARRLEYGWSKQAPQGMVRITVVGFQNYCREAALALK